MNQIKKPTLGLDLDGVIIDHTENKKKLAKDFGFEIATNETPTDIIKHKLPKDVWRKIQTLIYDDPVVGFSPPLVKGAAAGLELLSETGFKFFLISRRKSEGLPIELLKRVGLWPRYFNKSNTYFVKDKEAKNEKARELGVSAYIDDQPSVLEKLLSVPKKILFDEYGVFPESKNYTKIKTWAEFLEILKSL
ncbi:MAG: hypothetical protein AAB617_02145 [Patescibacteria group bacterium]